jgi:hypothetical protein
MHCHHKGILSNVRIPSAYDPRCNVRVKRLIFGKIVQLQSAIVSLLRMAAYAINL